MSAQYKNINNTKLDKSIVYKYKFWQRQSLFGTSTFSEDIGLAASQSCRENRCFSVRIHALNDGIVITSRPNCHALCRAALRRTQVVDECNASVCSFIATLFHVLLYSPRSRTYWVTPLTLSSLMSHSPWVYLKSDTHYRVHHHVIVLALLYFNFHQ